MVKVSSPAEGYEVQGGEAGGKEGGAEGGEEKGGTEQVMRRAKRSAMTPIFDEIKITFEKWRMGGQHVGNAGFWVFAAKP